MPKPHARIEQIEQNHAVFHKFVENARSQIIARWSDGVLFFVPFVEGVYGKIVTLPPKKMNIPRQTLDSIV